MPFKKEDYPWIPAIVNSIHSEAAQKAFIDSLTDEEVLSLVDPQYMREHQLIDGALQSKTGVKFLSDRLFEMRSKKMEATEEKGRQNSEGFLATFDTLSIEAKNTIVVNEFNILLACQSYTVLRSIIDTVLCPRLLGCEFSCDLDKIDRNDNLSASEKENLKQELRNYFYFMQSPGDAIDKSSVVFLKFVSTYFPSVKTDGVNYARWYSLLHDVLDERDDDDDDNNYDDPIYDPLLVFVSQADMYEKESFDFVTHSESIYVNLFDLSSTLYLDANENAFVGKFFTHEFKDENLGSLGITLASENYNTMFRKGLLHLKIAAEKDHAEAKSLLKSICFNTKDQQEPEPEYKVKIISAAQVASHEHKHAATEAEAINKMAAALKEKVSQFDKIEWHGISRQFQKAADADLKPAEELLIATLATLKIRIEKAEMGSAIQMGLLNQLHEQLVNAIQCHYKKQSLLSFILVDPHKAWLAATLEITRNCREKYYQCFPQIEVRVEHV